MRDMDDSNNDNAAMQKKIQTFENKSHRKLLGITYYKRGNKRVHPQNNDRINR